MKKLTLATLSLAILTASPLALSATTTVPATTAPVNTANPDLAKVGYSFGYMMGEGNKDVVDDLDLEAFYRGFKDAYHNNVPTLTEKQMQTVLLDYQKHKEAEYAKKLQELGKKNLVTEQDFLAKNGKKAGVQTTASGLQYQVLKQGNGKSAKSNDLVTVHYEGKLLDGTVFDSSYKRGEPVEFPLDKVIKGWTEGVQLMKEGSKYRFYIPSSLAYGEAGNVGIEPNSLLIFDIELLKVKPQAQAVKK